MKKTLTLLALTAVTAALGFGCAGAQTKVNQDLAAVNQGLAAATANLNQVTQAVTTTAQAAATVVTAATVAANTTMNQVSAVQAQVQSLGAEAQNLKTRASLITHFSTHTVVKGDTLWALSRANYQTGFLWPLLAEQNGIANGNLIAVGQAVRVAQADVLATYDAADRAPYLATAYQAK